MVGWWGRGNAGVAQSTVLHQKVAMVILAAKNWEEEHYTRRNSEAAAEQLNDPAEISYQRFERPRSRKTR